MSIIAGPAPDARYDPWIVAGLAPLPALAAFAVFGVALTNDSGSYLAYAEALRLGGLPAGEAALRSGPSPPTLFRTIGYPALLAGLQAASPLAWTNWLAALAMAGQVVIALASHRVGRAFGLSRGAAMLAALMPALGLAAFAQIAVMTDAIYATLTTGAALLLLCAGLRPGRLMPVAAAGCLLGVACLVREATPYLALGYLPAAAIAAGPGRWLVGAGLVLLPVVAVAGIMIGEMDRRAGVPMLSTSRQTVMVQAVLPILQRGWPLFDGDDLFDRTARETVVPLGYAGMDALHMRLFDAGMSAPEIAAIASSRYLRAWSRYPWPMLRGMAARFPLKMLHVPFQPLDALADLYRQTGTQRPGFVRLDLLWAGVATGSLGSVALLIALAASRLFGTVLTLLAMATPLLLHGDPRRLALFGAWAICGAFIGVYLPVHLEQRYLVPIVPLVCLLGMIGLAEVLRWRVR